MGAGGHAVITRPGDTLDVHTLKNDPCCGKWRRYIMDTGPVDSAPGHMARDADAWEKLRSGTIPSIPKMPRHRVLPLVRSFLRGTLQVLDKHPSSENPLVAAQSELVGHIHEVSEMYVTTVTDRRDLRRVKFEVHVDPQFEHLLKTHNGQPVAWSYQTYDGVEDGRDPREVSFAKKGAYGGAVVYEATGLTRCSHPGVSDAIEMAGDAEPAPAAAMDVEVPQSAPVPQPAPQVAQPPPAKVVERPPEREPAREPVRAPEREYVPAKTVTTGNPARVSSAPTAPGSVAEPAAPRGVTLDEMQAAIQQMRDAHRVEMAEAARVAAEARRAATESTRSSSNVAIRMAHPAVAALLDNPTPHANRGIRTAVEELRRNMSVTGGMQEVMESARDLDALLTMMAPPPAAVSPAAAAALSPAEKAAAASKEVDEEDDDESGAGSASSGQRRAAAPKRVRADTLPSEKRDRSLGMQGLRYLAALSQGWDGQ